MNEARAKVTAEEFERAYADRSQVSVEWLRRYRVVMRCACGDSLCKGWAMVPIESKADYEPGGIYYAGDAS